MSEQMVLVPKGLLGRLLAREKLLGLEPRSERQCKSFQVSRNLGQKRSSIPCSSSLCLPLTIPCSSLEFMGMRVMLPWLGFCSARL